MQKAGGSNDMIALVWFVSRFFVTKAFGRASPPAFSFGFPCFHIHFKNKLNRNGLLVHCGILTSTVWYIFFFFFLGHGIIFLCMYFTQVWGLWSPRSNPPGQLRTGKVNEQHCVNTRRLRQKAVGEPEAAASANEWLENRTKLSRASLEDWLCFCLDSVYTRLVWKGKFSLTERFGHSVTLWASRESGEV